MLFLLFGIFPSFKNYIMGAERHMIKEMVELVCNGLSVYERRVREGAMSLEEALRKAKERIRFLRYGPEMKDYFWINDVHGRMLMHPYRKDLEGKNIIDLQDKNGKYLIREFLKIVKEKGQGYVDYMWQWKDDPNRIVPKVSFVKGFEPWGRIVGTGIYIEDAKAEIGVMSRKLAYISLGILVLVSPLMLYVIRQGIKIERSREEVEGFLKESEARFRKLIEDAPFGVSIMRTDGTFEYVNPQFIRLFGYTLEDVPDKAEWFEKAYRNPQLRKKVISAWEKDIAEL